MALARIFVYLCNYTSYHHSIFSWFMIEPPFRFLLFLLNVQNLFLRQQFHPNLPTCATASAKHLKHRGIV